MANLWSIGRLFMEQHIWCEHGEKISKYTFLNYECRSKSITQRIQSWFCPECGAHGAHSEILDTTFTDKNQRIGGHPKHIAEHSH